MGNKEVRDILLGRILPKDEQFWTAAPADARFHFHGIKDGAGDVRLFGVTHKTRCYEMAEVEPTIALAAAETALYSMGKPMQLDSMPEAKGCLYAPKWIAPVLLTIEQDEDGLQMTAYTGRSLVFSWFRCRIALWLLERRLPAGSADTGKRRNPDGERAEKKVLKREAPKRAEPKREEPKRKEPKRVELKKTEPKQKETAKRLATGTASAKKSAPKRLRK